MLHKKKKGFCFAKKCGRPNSYYLFDLLNSDPSFIDFKSTPEYKMHQTKISPFFFLCNITFLKLALIFGNAMFSPFFPFSELSCDIDRASWLFGRKL